MTLLGVPSFINVELNPPCRKKNSSCEVKHEKPFDVDAKLTMNSCPDDKFKGTMKIGPSLLIDTVEIDYEILCECDCEKGGEINWDKCSGNGTYQCGICYCNKDR